MPLGAEKMMLSYFAFILPLIDLKMIKKGLVVAHVSRKPRGDGLPGMFLPETAVSISGVQGRRGRPGPMSTLGY